MKPPVRVVCRGCLRSVEIESGDPNPGGGVCPFCSQALDSRDVLAAASDERRPTLESGEFAASGHSEWAATWSRGSLGVLGRFQIRDRLGDGGFGEVYLAYDPRLDRDVALKVLRQASPSDRVMERFFREARAAARLDHPNIVAVYDSGYDQNRCWVAYQRIVGKPLWWYFEHRPIAPEEAARLLRELAEAVDYAHRNGVFHRDIKPANILIDELGRPRLIDFGLSRRADLDSTLTRDGTVIGTPAYMSPEQAQGYSRLVDERSDVFSLGMVLCEALGGLRTDTATTIKAGADREKTLEALASVETWANVAHDVPSGLVAICRRATAERPEDRYPNARALADDLDAWLREREKPRTLPAPRPGGLVTVFWTIMILVGLLGGFAAAQLRSLREQPSPRPAPATPSSAVPIVQALALEVPAAQTPEVEDAPIEAPEGPLLVGNRKSKRYHLASCADLRAMLEENRVHFGSLEAAKAEKFGPCDHCVPTPARIEKARSTR